MGQLDRHTVHRQKNAVGSQNCSTHLWRHCDGVLWKHPKADAILSHQQASTPQLGRRQFLRLQLPMRPTTPPPPPPCCCSEWWQQHEQPLLLLLLLLLLPHVCALACRHHHHTCCQQSSLSLPLPLLHPHVCSLLLLLLLLPCCFDSAEMVSRASRCCSQPPACGFQ